MFEFLTPSFFWTWGGILGAGIFTSGLGMFWYVMYKYKMVPLEYFQIGHETV